MKRESDFQGGLIKEIEKRFPGSIVTKLDANHIQGIPDLLILHKNKWATLECKKSEKEMEKCVSKNTPPNQKYYVDLMNKMSFSSYIYPENKEDVLNDLQRTFES